jgi:hypothetical protein
MIQKANPTVQVDFTKGPRKEQEYQIPPHGKYLLPDNYPLGKKIRELNIEGLMQVKLKKDIVDADPKVKSTRPLLFIVLLLFLFFLLALPLITTLSFSLLGFAMLGNTNSTIEKGSIANAQKSASVAKILFYLAKKSSILLLTEGKLIGQEKNLDEVTKTLVLVSIYPKWRYTSQMDQRICQEYLRVEALMQKRISQKELRI